MSALINIGYVLGELITQALTPPSYHRIGNLKENACSFSNFAPNSLSLVHQQPDDLVHLRKFAPVMRHVRAAGSTHQLYSS
jgi:hypothetical protein